MEQTMKTKLGEDINVKFQLYYELDHSSVQFSYDVLINVGDKNEAFTRVSSDMRHAVIKTGEDAEGALQLSLWNLWMLVNHKLRNVLEEMNVVPKYDPDWWGFYTKNEEEE